MTAAIFVMSSLRNGFLNRHSKMAAPLLQTEEDPIAHPDLAHTNRSAVRCYETNRFRVLDDRGIAGVPGLRLGKGEGRPSRFFRACPTLHGCAPPRPRRGGVAPRGVRRAA